MPPEAQRTRRAPTRDERRAHTRAQLIEAAEQLFTAQGFHATSMDAVADAAGYTKGAVYWNYASKEDLFFAVYERRVDTFLPELERAMAEAVDVEAALLSVTAAHRARREREHDGWLAVFLEFWTHVLRHPEHRARFAAVHQRYLAPYTEAMQRWANEHDLTLPLDARRLTIAATVMITGLALERLTQPDVVDVDLAVQAQQLWMDGLRAHARHSLAQPGTHP